MTKKADEFFQRWQRAWETGTGAVLEHVTDDIEYWDVTLPEPIHGRADYADYVDGFFRAFTEIEWSLREPVVAEGERVAEPWSFRGRHSGPLWIGLPATGRVLQSAGTDIFEFRDGKVCREHSFFDVTANLRALGLWPAMGSRSEKLAMGASGLAVRARTALARRNGGGA